MSTIHDSHTQMQEIDLRELTRTLWSGRFLILACAAIFTAVAFAYAYLSPAIYEARAQILPPTEADLAEYNSIVYLVDRASRDAARQSEPPIAALQTGDAYGIFLKHLESSAVRREFFVQYYRPAMEKLPDFAPETDLWSDLEQALTISAPKRSTDYRTSVLMKGPSPDTAATLANNYVSLALAAANLEVEINLTTLLKSRSEVLNREINSLRQVAQATRDNEIDRLSDALAIAEASGLEQPAGNSTVVNITAPVLGGGTALHENSALYMRGARALRAELARLKERTNDDAYIGQLNDLFSGQALLGSIKMEPTRLSTATIDEKATAPQQPIAPRKALAIILGLIIGIVLGMSAVIVRRAFR